LSIDKVVTGGHIRQIVRLVVNTVAVDVMTGVLLDYFLMIPTFEQLIKSLNQMVEFDEYGCDTYWQVYMQPSLP